MVYIDTMRVHMLVLVSATRMGHPLLPRRPRPRAAWPTWGAQGVMDSALYIRTLEDAYRIFLSCKSYVYPAPSLAAAEALAAATGSVADLGSARHHKVDTVWPHIHGYIAYVMYMQLHMQLPGAFAPRGFGGAGRRGGQRGRPEARKVSLH